MDSSNRTTDRAGVNLVSAGMRRPITVLVLIAALGAGAVFAVRQMPRDIFPDLGVPVIYVAQPYGGMDPAQMEGLLTNYYEYHFLYISGIEHVESKSIQGVSLIKLQFHPGTNMAQAMAETISYVNRARAFMPPGTVPPFVMRFDAGSVPVGNLVFTSERLSVRELQDAALFKVRPLFATLSGVSAPPPFGASQRTIVIRVDPDRLRAFDMSPDEVIAAIGSANAISPSGNVRIGDMMPMVPVNSLVRDIKDLERVPIRSGVWPTVFVRDVATVEDSADITTGYALVNGRRTVYIPVTKRSDASTLAVVDLVKTNLPKFQAVLPEGVTVSYEFDQSPYVKRAISGLIFEGTLGAVLTGLMVLLFLRDWCSAFIVVVNIPHSLLAAVVALWVTGQTVNIMTLGGLALAVGILVDEATVTIENIHAHRSRGKAIAWAAFDASNETVVPRLLAMLCVLAVFVPSLFMVGAARALFVPLALAAGFSMVGSYLLSSTLVPILSIWLLGRQRSGREGAHPSSFARFQSAYRHVTQILVRFRWPLLLAYAATSGVVTYFVGRDLGTEIFPTVDSGQFQLRLRAPTGTRIERTEQLALTTLDAIATEVGRDNINLTLGFVGVQPSTYPINSIHLWTAGPEEAVLQVQLKHGTGIHVELLKERLRSKLPILVPDIRISFEPSDIVSRVMSFGSPTPIEIAVSGPNLAANREFAEKIHDRLATIASLRDLQYGQALDYPTARVQLDRERGGLLGITAADVSRSLLSATSSSRYVVPLFWPDPTSGVGYQVQIEIPQARMASFEDVRNLPVARKQDQQLLLRDVARVMPDTAVGEYDRYNMQRLVTLTANVVGEDLGRASKRIDRAIADSGTPPPRVTTTTRGQITPMRQMLDGLRSGLLLTIAVIFLLLSASFQSLKLALIVVSTVPAAIAGVAVALWMSGTTLNVQSFMGATMAIGVAVANAILLVTFAERSRTAGDLATAAAVEGAASRLRPILMTSLAMIAGMLPMALALGEGGEQTAPLGRAVIGGLIGATLATLSVLPCVFAIVQARSSTRSPSLDPRDFESIDPPIAGGP
jgi:multidrug efflux pump subunit AcrB